MMLPRFLPFTPKFKMKVDEMLASGLIQRWHAEFYRIVADKKLFVEEFEPQVLTVESLQLGFSTFLISLTFTLVAFLAELAINAVKLRASSLIAFCTTKKRRERYSLAELNTNANLSNVSQAQLPLSNKSKRHRTKSTNL